MNPFRKVWLAAKVKAALGGDMSAIEKIAGWLFKIDIVPSGYLTLIGGWGSILFYLLCLLHVQIPGLGCPDNPVEALMGGLGLIGLGRRGKA